MAFKMIATRTVYRAEEAREYQKGQSFTVKTERERDRLLRAQKARLDDTKSPSIKTMKAPEPRPAVFETKVMTPSEPASSDPAPDTAFSQPERRSNRYRRSDLRSED